MKEFFRSIQKDSVLLWSFWISIIFVFLSVGSILLSYGNLPPVIPLYNSLPWGYARLGKTYELLIPPFVVLGICILNSIVGIRLVGKSPLLTRFLFLTIVILSLFTFIFTARLIFTTL